MPYTFEYGDLQTNVSHEEKKNPTISSKMVDNWRSLTRTIGPFIGCGSWKVKTDGYMARLQA